MQTHSKASTHIEEIEDETLAYMAYPELPQQSPGFPRSYEFPFWRVTSCTCSRFINLRERIRNPASLKGPMRIPGSPSAAAFIAKPGSNTPLLAANVDGASSFIAHVGHTVRNEAGSIVYVDTPSACSGEVHSVGLLCISWLTN